jgi:outer membrane protein assembly factor BamD (BamD/ComL family)
MKKLLVYSSLLLLYCLSSCSSDAPAVTDEKQQMISEIDSLHSKMVNPQTMELNKDLAKQALAAYEGFVLKFPEDSLSPEYLFRASDIARGVGDYAKAMEDLKKICSQYPNYRKVPESIFLQGYYLQEFFGDTVAAKEYYKQLISKYPEHPFADDAKALMSMFGKSEADIIKGFEEKAKAQKN